MTEKPSLENNYDPKAEKEELERLIEEQRRLEKDKEDKERKDLIEIEKAERELQEIENDEKARNDKRILDELQDRKEEDGGEYRD